MSFRVFGLNLSVSNIGNSKSSHSCIEFLNGNNKVYGVCNFAVYVCS